MALCWLNKEVGRILNEGFGILLILFLPVALVGCHPKATGPLFQPMREILPEQAIVYLYYPAFGWNVFPREVLVDGVSLKVLHGEEYYPFVTTSGTKTFALQHDLSKALIKLTLEHERVYYLRVTQVSYGVKGGTLTLREVSESIALEEIRQCRLMYGPMSK